MKKGKENTNIVNSVNTENKDIVNSVNTENKDIGNSEIVYSDIEKTYTEIQQEITKLTKKGDFIGITNLLKEKSDIIEKYQQYQKQKEEEKKQKLQELDQKIQEKISLIDQIKEEIRNLKEEKKKIQGYNMNMDNSNSKTRIINRISHEYQYNMNKTNKAIDIIYTILQEYNISKEAWNNFNHDHSISWNYFIEQVKKGKYPQKTNLQKLLNSDNLNTFYQKVKEITIS